MLANMFTYSNISDSINIDYTPQFRTTCLRFSPPHQYFNLFLLDYNP